MPFLLAATESLSPLLRDMVIILAAAAVVGVALQRLRLATIPAYLITGALIGPGALGFVSRTENVEAISNLAIVLLLFGVGLNMDIAILARGLKQMLAATCLATALCTAALWPVGLMLGASGAGALVVAMALSFSSTVVVLRVLQQRHELGHPEGRLAFGVLILQDIVAIVLLMLLPPLARWQGTGTVGLIPEGQRGSAFDLVLNMAANGALALGGIGLIIGFGRYLLPRLLTEAARSRSGEVLIVLTTAAALGAAALTQELVNNPAIGAFLAGFMISSTPFRHHLSAQIGAIRDLFSAVFFTAIGMSVSLGVLWQSWPVVLGAAALVIAAKGTLFAVSLWVSSTTGNTAIKAGFALSQAGEFSVLMLAAAAAPALALIDSTVLAEAVSLTVLTLMVTPALIHGLGWLSPRLPRISPPPWARAAGTAPGPCDGEGVGAGAPAESGPPPPHAIIAGFGLVGRAVADELKRIGGTYTVVELNPATVRRQVGLGREIVFGDVSSEEVLEMAGIRHADLLVITVPDGESVMRACGLARRIKPGIAIIARTNFVSQGVLVAGLGADGVVVEEMATAKEMEKMLHTVLARRARERAGG